MKTDQQLRVLYVEDHAVFATTVRTTFLADCDVTIVARIDTARRLLSTSDAAYELLLCDYDLEDGKGDELVRTVADRLPCIGVSAHEAGNAALLAAGCVASCGKLEFARLREVIEATMQNRLVQPPMEMPVVP